MSKKAKYREQKAIEGAITGVLFGLIYGFTFNADKPGIWPKIGPAILLATVFCVWGTF